MYILYYYIVFRIIWHEDLFVISLDKIFIQGRLGSFLKMINNNV